MRTRVEVPQPGVVDPIGIAIERLVALELVRPLKMRGCCRCTECSGDRLLEELDRAGDRLQARRAAVVAFALPRAELVGKACLTQHALRWELDVLAELCSELMDRGAVEGSDLANNVLLGLHDLGGAERLTRAEELLGRAIEIAEKHFEADHPTLAIPLLQPRAGAPGPRRR